MSALTFLLAAALAGDAHLEVHTVDGQALVDVSASSAAPAEFLRALAEKSGRSLRGEDLLLGAEPLELHLQGRPIDSVLRALALATHTSIGADAHAITISPARATAKPEELELEAQAAWLRIVRDFPDHESARMARLELGRAQEKLGHEEAALAHYDAAVRTDAPSPAMELALRASSELLARRGEWGEAQRRLSQLAVRASSDALRAQARVATARMLAMQGRGPESLALLDAVDLSFPPRDDADAQDRRLVRARGYLAAGNAREALRELDQRAAAHKALGSTSEDLELRARSLEMIGATLEASRAWLACASLSGDRAKIDALIASARLAAAGGDDLSVLMIARLAEGDPRGARLQEMARDIRERLGFDAARAGSSDSADALEARWAQRARLAPSDRVALAARCVSAVARARSVEDAAQFARTAMSELDGADGSPIRSALAASYERRGLWERAANVWSGGEP
jgi:hypothetical protein